jgi:hypothetical protein
VEWHNTSFGLKATYQVVNDLYGWLSVVNSNISGNNNWSPEYFFGKRRTLNMGVTFGF